MKYLISGLVFCLSVYYQSYSADKTSISLPYSHPDICYEGRIDTNSSKTAAEIFWPGSSVSLSFHGVGLTATLEDESGDNYFTIVVDGVQDTVLHLKAGKHEYVLAADLEPGKHTVSMHKRNDWYYGQTQFFGFGLDGNSTFPQEQKDFFIEFYGNSITTGYGNEDYTGADRSTGDVTNNYLAYGAITARNLDAEYACISHSGIGIMVSWHDIIMQEEYYRIDPSDSSSLWDFSLKQPDVVVVNLFQNDSWIVNLPDNDQFQIRFGDTPPTDEEYIDQYLAFLNTLRGHYPDAEFICLLGNMDITQSGSKWPGMVEEAVARFEGKVHTLFIPYKNTGGHPKVEEQEVLAEELIALIRSIKE